MMGLPDQSFADWEATLTEAVSWNPEHLSCYSLIVEEGTPLYVRQEQGLLNLPDEDEERRMYHWTVAYLAEHGYRQYEISNFAKEGRASRHNLGYWDRVPYRGVGLGAASLIREGDRQIRYKNTENLTDYLQNSGQPERIRKDRQILSETECREEFFFLGLRKAEGVGEKEYEQAFGCRMDEIYGKELTSLQRSGLLEYSEGRYRLTPRGMDLGNQVFAAFLTEENL
jgi:oxygen-independent coproporphyrinogen-3 oxidase